MARVRSARGQRLLARGSELQPAAAAVDAGDSGTFAALRVAPDFRLLWSGTLMTNSAFWMYQIAVGWLALERTDSPFFVGLTGFAGGIPLLFLALPAGVVIDRIDRRTVLIAAQVATMSVAILFALLVATDTIERWSILLLSLLYGSAMSFVFPTRNAMVPSLVRREHLLNAVALNAAGQNSTRVVGPSIAGILIALIGTAGTFGVAAALQIAALYWTGRLPASAPSEAARAISLRRNLGTGLSFIARDPSLTGLVLLAAVSTVLVMPYIGLLPVFARDELGLGATGLGVLMACNGIGSVAGALAVAGMRQLAGVRGIQVWSSLAFAVLVLVFAQVPLAGLAALLLIVSGVASAAYMAINNTVLQMRVDDDVRGRVLSVYLLTWGLLPLGQLPIGALADRFGAPNAVSAACVAGVALIAVLTWRFPSLRA